MIAKAFASAVVVLALVALAPPVKAAGFCTMVWAPVCGLKNGAEKTYSNAGCAKADDATVSHEGACGEQPAPQSSPQVKP
jgi:hypothetical protein